MFDRIAGVYDVMNSVMTAGMHQRWRERAAEMAALGPGDSALDVATGTGDLALALAERVGPDGEVVGSDFSEGMLELARRKAPELRFEWGNALELPYEDDSFDAATSAGSPSAVVTSRSGIGSIQVTSGSALRFATTGSCAGPRSMGRARRSRP